MNAPWIKVLVIGGALVLGFGSYLLTQKPDGAVEQAAEAVLRSQGVDVDLSPSDHEE